ncbi:hypothetical protein BC831DRAFT_462615 [Entophlyctis helioformis]|nr:hypothetical protein BC831DRAFT_462615 [Entophlyctis helioformis]
MRPPQRIASSSASSSSSSLSAAAAAGSGPGSSSTKPVLEWSPPDQHAHLHHVVKAHEPLSVKSSPVPGSAVHGPHHNQHHHAPSKLAASSHTLLPSGAAAPSAQLAAVHSNLSNLHNHGHPVSTAPVAATATITTTATAMTNGSNKNPEPLLSLAAWGSAAAMSSAAMAGQSGFESAACAGVAGLHGFAQDALLRSGIIHRTGSIASITSIGSGTTSQTVSSGGSNPSDSGAAAGAGPPTPFDPASFLQSPTGSDWSPRPSQQQPQQYSYHASGPASVSPSQDAQTYHQAPTAEPPNHSPGATGSDALGSMIAPTSWHSPGFSPAASSSVLGANGSASSTNGTPRADMFTSPTSAPPPPPTLHLNSPGALSTTSASTPVYTPLIGLPAPKPGLQDPTLAPEAPLASPFRPRPNLPTTGAAPAVADKAIVAKAAVAETARSMHFDQRGVGAAGGATGDDDASGTGSGAAGAVHTPSAVHAFSPESMFNRLL